MCRLVRSLGYEVAVEQKEDGIYLTLRKAETTSVVQGHRVDTGTVLFIGSDILGRGGNRELGSLLMQGFLHTLSGLRSRPETIVLLNDGVEADDK